MGNGLSQSASLPSDSLRARVGQPTGTGVCRGVPFEDEQLSGGRS